MLRLSNEQMIEEVQKEANRKRMELQQLCEMQFCYALLKYSQIVRTPQMSSPFPSDIWGIVPFVAHDESSRP